MKIVGRNKKIHINKITIKVCQKFRYLKESEGESADS